MQRGHTVVIPDRNPREVLVAGTQIQVGLVGGVALAVVVESEDGVVRHRDTVNAVAPAVHAVLVLVEVVTEMEDIVHGVLAHRVSVGVEVTEWEVGARVNGQVDLVDLLLRIGAGLGAADGTLVVRVADLELVVVGGEGLQLGSFDLIIQLAEFVSLRSIRQPSLP